MAMYGYIRCSLLKGEKPPEVQIRELARKAEELGGVLSRVFVEPAVTGKLAGDKPAVLARPAGKEMLETLKGGDTLIVSRLDRLGYSVADVQATTKALCERRVGIYTLSSPIVITHLTPDIARVVLDIFALWGKTDRALRSERSTELAHRRKSIGLAYGGVPTGRRIVQRKGFKSLEWDDEELGHIAEIAYRLPREGAAKVAQDFWARGIKDRRGQLWGKQVPKTATPIREAKHLLRCLVGRDNRTVSPYQQFYRAARWFHRAKRKGLLPSPYGDLAECIEEPKGFREVPKPRKWTRGGAARREQQRAEAKARHHAERLARWEAQRAARVQSRVHKPKLLRQEIAPVTGE